MFLLGIWKDYEELESNISMQELTAILAAKREQDYDQKKFNAALQGVDLDKDSGVSTSQMSLTDYAEKMAGSEQGTSSEDIISLTGAIAEKAGFGINNGLDYEVSE